MYTLSDKAQKILNARAAKRFSKVKAALQRSGFDELNVIKGVKSLYKELERDNEEVFLDLAQRKYKEYNPDGKPPNRKWLLALLALTDPVTKYIYANEVVRKMERTTEGVNSVGAKATQLAVGLRYWKQMTAHYADAVTDESTLKAYKDTGVRKVRWITVEDDRTCEVCRERDGNIYPIDKVPPKPHYGCRCRLAAEKSR